MAKSLVSCFLLIHGVLIASASTTDSGKLFQILTTHSQTCSEPPVWWDCLQDLGQHSYLVGDYQCIVTYSMAA